MSELSKGWSKAAIGSLCSLENGRAFKPTDWKQAGLPIVRIQNLNNPNASFNYFDQEVSERYLLRGGELLFAWSGTPGTSFGTHIWRGEKAVLNQHIFRVDFNANLIDKRFFRFAINQKLNELIDIAHGGVGLRHVTKGKFEGTEVAIAPLNEQKRIADKLDRLLGRVDACRSRCDRIPLILKRFRQSVLAAATSGELTEDWREEFNEPVWSSSNAESLCEWITKGTTPAKGRMYESNGEIPYIKVYNLCFDGRLDFTINPTFIDRETHEVALKRSKVFPGDVLMNIVGPPLGKISIVPETYPEWNINQAIALFRPKDKIHNKFLAYVLMSEKTVAEMARKSKATAGQFNLTLEICRAIEVPVPSMLEQQEIVRRIEKLFAFADRLKARYKTARAQVDRLTPALLEKAFQGELVPQDPNDEPASVLLERIRSELTVAKADKADKRQRVSIVSQPSVAPVIMLTRKDIQPAHLSSILKTRGSLTAENLWAESQLEIDDFYDQLKDEEMQGLLRETRVEEPNALRLLEAA